MTLIIVCFILIARLHLNPQCMAKLLLLFYLVLLALRVASVVWGIASGDFRHSILLFALSGAVVNGALTVWYMRLVARYESNASL